MANKKEDKKSILNFNISIGRVSLVQKAIFARNLSLMLKSGLTLTEAIEITHQQATGKLKKVLVGVFSSIKSGQSLADSFNRYPRVFSNMFIDVTRAGELSGNLEGNLSNIADHLEKEKDLISKIRGAIFYPVMVFIAAFGLGLAMAFFVLPKITPLFEGLKTELPITTRALIWISGMIRDHGTILLVSLIGIVIILIWLVRRKFSQPFTHWLLLNIPLIKKIVCYTNLARFCRILSTLLKSGLNIDEAMEITKKTLGNIYYQRSLNYVSRQVSRGNKLASSLERSPKLYPLLTTRMIRVGEKSGNLDETLSYLADFYDTEVNNLTKSLSTIIEPILLIVIGLAVAFLALSIITPIYQITGNVRR